MSKIRKISNRYFAIFLFIMVFALSVPSEAGLFIGNYNGIKAKTMKIAATDPINSFEKVAENARLSLYVQPETLGIKVLNKDTGYVWNATLDEDDEKLNEIWQYFFQSGLTVEYMDKKRKIRQASIIGEKANIRLEKQPNGFQARINYEALGFQLSLQVELLDDSIQYSIPYSSIIEEKEENQIESIYIFPYLGASKGIQNGGYIFVPDGSGALIKLDQATLSAQPYISRIYGEDFGISGVKTPSQGTLSTPVEQVSIPVYGIAQEDGVNAFITMIKSGASYAEIRAYPSGITTDYNWVTGKWIYRETYFQQVDQKGNGFQVNQEEKNVFDAIGKVMFLANQNANYVGMALRVQSELVQDGILTKKRKNDKALPIRIDFIVAEQKKQLLGNKVVTMTTVDEADEILEDLRKNQVDSLSVVVNGWSKGGSMEASPTHFPFETAVGDEQKWKQLIQKYQKLGVPVYFYVDYVLASKRAKGYSDSDIAQAISERLLIFFDRYLFLEPLATKRILQEEIRKYQQYRIDYLAMDTIGKTLFSSYSKPFTAREEAIQIYQSILSEMDGINVALIKPNQYLWKYTNEILEIPMNTSNYLIETESVPFIQIVLKGYINYYASASNFFADPIEGTLKLIDYGALPFFYLTNQDPVELLNTPSEWLYTSQYSIWKDEVLREYRLINQALLPVKDATYVSRDVIEEGIVKNTYSNGVSIYINYTENPYTSADGSIPAQSFLVVGGGS